LGHGLIPGSIVGSGERIESRPDPGDVGGGATSARARYHARMSRHLTVRSVWPLFAAALLSINCQSKSAPPSAAVPAAAPTPAAAPMVLSASARRPLRIAYSDWPGWTAFEVGIQKGWFKEAGVEVEFSWFDYLPSLDAFSAGKVDAVMVTNGDALVTGASGAKSKIILLTDYSNGNDQVIGRPGLKSMKQLKGKKVGLELTLVEHLLFLKALEKSGMKVGDVELVNFPTSETPQALASGQVSAIAAWYPISARARKALPGATPLFTSANVPGLIYDALAVEPRSLEARRAEWKKVVAVWYRISDFVRDPKTQSEAVAIMAAKAGVKAADYAANMTGTYFLTAAEAKKCFQKGDSLESIYGSSKIADTFNVANKVYKKSEPVDDYIYPDFVLSP
jgi:NitT/TauT family transport system substrate-binding protein